MRKEEMELETLKKTFIKEVPNKVATTQSLDFYPVNDDSFFMLQDVLDDDERVIQQKIVQV